MIEIPEWYVVGGKATYVHDIWKEIKVSFDLHYDDGYRWRNLIDAWYIHAYGRLKPIDEVVDWCAENMTSRYAFSKESPLSINTDRLMFSATSERDAVLFAMRWF